MTQFYWTLDKNSAQKVGAGNYINGNTVDLFKIISAAWKSKPARNGGDNYFLTLHVVNRDKATTHLDILYGNSSGKRYSGSHLINALMMCANTAGLSQVQGTYLEFDFDSKSDQNIQGIVAPELANRKVGLFLSERHYMNEKGELKTAPELFNVYDAETNQLAGEKAAGRPANPDEFERVRAAMIASGEKSLIKATGQPNAGGFNNQMSAPAMQQASQMPQDTTYKKTPISAPPQQQQPMQQQTPMMGDDDIDDGDIPF